MQDWAGNCVRLLVPHGTFSHKIKFPKLHVVGERGEVGFYFRWMRNSDSFAKETVAVRERLGFCWRLEGAKFERREDFQ